MQGVDLVGGADPGKAAKYILYRFSQMKQRSDMMVYPQYIVPLFLYADL